MHCANLTPGLIPGCDAALVAAPHAAKPNTPAAAAITIPSVRTLRVLRAR